MTSDNETRRTFCPEDGHPCYTPKGPEPEGFECGNYGLCKSFERKPKPSGVTPPTDEDVTWLRRYAEGHESASTEARLNRIADRLQSTSPIEVGGLREARRVLNDFADELERGEVFIEDFPPELIERLKAALSQSSSPVLVDRPEDVGLVEKVARAIYDAEPVPPGMEALCNYDYQKAINGPNWVLYKRAQAAIEAILTPYTVDEATKGFGADSGSMASPGTPDGSPPFGECHG